jgi:8-oxo-dGTP diphosphatase
MALPYRISTLLYCFHENGDVLLLHRKLEPNRDLWSPPGGKLDTLQGESPYACACREAHEELGISIRPSDLHLTGLVSERGYESAAHWLMFLFEVLPRFKQLPPAHREGQFEFFPPSALGQLPLPQTDREMIWPLFWQHRGGFFAAHCQCLGPSRNQWSIEEGRPPSL